MARYKDIFNAIEYATSESCPNRLLAFAKVRSVAIGGAAAAQSAAQQIVNRFCNVALENQRMGLWSLDLLQMCTLHGGDAFALALNNQGRLNELLAFFLNPTKVKSVSVQIQLKLLSLIQTWAITYKNTFSSNNFEYAHDRLKRSGMVSNVDGLRNLHWLPDKDVFGNSTESTTYNLQEVVSEMSTENKQLHSELQTIFKMASEQHTTGVSEDPKFKKKLAEASKRTLEIKQAVHASQAFWNDIVEHLEIEPEDFKEITSNVQCIFESMEQSITYCITALKMDSSIRTEDDSSKNGGLDGDHKEGEPANTNRTGSEQHQFENRLYNKAKSPVSSPQEPVKEKDNQAQRWKSTPGRKEKTIFNPYIEVQPKPPIVYSEPYVPLNLDKSPTTPPAPATGTAENVMGAAPGLRPATLTKPKTYVPHVSVQQMPQVNRFDGGGYIRTSTRSNITTERKGRESFGTQVENFPQLLLSGGNVPRSEIPKQMQASNTKNPEVRRLISKQTQTEVKESAGPPVTNSRPINVQCNDCQTSFSDLNKLLSHPCRMAVPSNVSKTDLPLFSASSFPHPPPVQAISHSTANGIAPLFCQECGLDFDEKHLFEAHLLTPRHKFSAGRRRSVSRNAPIVFPNPSLEQTKKVSSLAFADVSYSNSRFPRENIVDTSRVGYPRGQPPHQSQISLMRVKAVETIDVQLHGSAVHPTARAVEGAARHIPGHSIQSGIAAKPLEGSVAPGDGASQEINSLMQKHKITARGNLLFCNVCFVYLHYGELNEHISCVDHQKNIAMDQRTAAPSSNQEANESAKPVVRMPSLPSLYSTHPGLPDANYIAVYVPAEQAMEGESGRRPIFTQYVSLGSPKFPPFNAATEAKGSQLERGATVRRLL